MTCPGIRTIHLAHAPAAYEGRHFHEAELRADRECQSVSFKLENECDVYTRAGGRRSQAVPLQFVVNFRIVIAISRASYRVVSAITALRENCVKKFFKL